MQCIRREEQFFRRKTATRSLDQTLQVRHVATLGIRQASVRVSECLEDAPLTKKHLLLEVARRARGEGAREKAERGFSNTRAGTRQKTNHESPIATEFKNIGKA